MPFSSSSCIAPERLKKSVGKASAMPSSSSFEINLTAIFNPFNYILSAPHELQSLPMRHLYLSAPAAHPVFITHRNVWQFVHFSFGRLADSKVFTASFTSSFITQPFQLLSVRRSRYKSMSRQDKRSTPYPCALLLQESVGGISPYRGSRFQQ